MKIKALVMLAAMLPAQGFGFTSLCVEDVSTGFDWQDDRWVQRTFTTRQHIVQRIDESNEIASNCYAGIASNPRVASGASSMGCYSIRLMGEESRWTNVWPCFENNIGRGGQPFDSVICMETTHPFRMEPNGEFVITQNVAIPDYEDREIRDSIAISVGKCSVISE